MMMFSVAALLLLAGMAPGPDPGSARADCL